MQYDPTEHVTLRLLYNSTDVHYDVKLIYETIKISSAVAGA